MSRGVSPNVGGYQVGMTIGMLFLVLAALIAFVAAIPPVAPVRLMLVAISLGCGWLGLALNGIHIQ